MISYHTVTENISKILENNYFLSYNEYQKKAFSSIIGLIWYLSELRIQNVLTFSLSLFIAIATQLKIMKLSSNYSLNI